MGSGDVYSMGRAPSGAISGGAEHGRAPSLEPPDLGRVRRHLGEPRPAPALLPRESPPGPALLLHDANPGGGPSRRGVLAHGRAPGRLLPAAAEPADRRRGWYTRSAAGGPRPRHVTRGD